MRRLIGVWALALVAAAFPAGLAGQRPTPPTTDVTFARDVAPILYANCSYCHRPGEVAPFALLSYRDARPWARSIKQAVTRRVMPPWGADPHFGEFGNSRRLTDSDIATIVAWVDAGAPEGNPADAPAPPQFTDGWQIGTPDLVLTMAEPVKIPASGTIPYIDAPTDFVLEQDTWIQAIAAGQSPRGASRGRAGDGAR